MTVEFGLPIVFVIGYLFIAAESYFKVDKAAVALITGVFGWVMLAIGSPIDPLETAHNLGHHLEETAGILLFLMGAMTIVEVIDAHNGFSIITNLIRSDNKRKLLWSIGLISFFLSAVLDNLTTSIVMMSIVRKLIDDNILRWKFAGIIIIAANAGGAWSPIGDVTTTMLWISGRVTAWGIIKSLLVVSLVSLVVPLMVLGYSMKGNLQKLSSPTNGNDHSPSHQLTTLLFGLGGLLFVPVFKSLTHLPPFMGMMLSLGVLWVTTEIIHKRKEEEERSKFSALQALQRIDMPSVLFFLGILLAVAALQESNHLSRLAEFMSTSLRSVDAINVGIGLLSAIIDNVPLVAASIGMYPLSDAGAVGEWAGYFAQDGRFWEFLAYCAGTGGSVLIIGSAAGVAVMGMEKITFTWYLRHISIPALLGYLLGAATYIVLHSA